MVKDTYCIVAEKYTVEMNYYENFFEKIAVNEEVGKKFQLNDRNGCRI